MFILFICSMFLLYPADQYKRSTWLGPCGTEHACEDGDKRLQIPLCVLHSSSGLDPPSASLSLPPSTLQATKEKEGSQAQLKVLTTQTEAVRRELTEVLGRLAHREEELHRRDVELSEAHQRHVSLEQENREVRGWEGRGAEISHVPWILKKNCHIHSKGQSRVLQKRMGTVRPFCIFFGRKKRLMNIKVTRTL